MPLDSTMLLAVAAVADTTAVVVVAVLVGALEDMALVVVAVRLFGSSNFRWKRLRTDQGGEMEES